MKDVNQVIYDLLTPEKRGRLLDAGSGDGKLSEALEKLGFQVFSLDKYESPPPKTLRFLAADLERHLPYREKVFDYIVCSGILQYLDNQRHLFRECQRLLKDGGLFIVGLPNILSIKSRFYFLRRGFFSEFKPFRNMRKDRVWDRVVYNPISFVEVFNLMQRHGFEPIRVLAPRGGREGWIFFPFFRLLYRLGLVFEQNEKKAKMIRHLSTRDLLTGDHIVVLGRKRV